MRRVFIALSIIFLINIFSFYYDWYLRFFWFDMVLHLSGGFFVAMFMAYYLKDNLGKSKLKNSLILIGVTAFVGAIWEFTEYIASQTLIEPIYNAWGIKTYFIGDLNDTISDLTMDVVGALLFSAFWLKIRINNLLN